MNSLRVVAVVLFAALAGVGYYAWQLRAKFVGSVESSQTAIADGNTKLGDCAKARDLEKGAREDAEKLATANLNASRTELDDLRKDRLDADKRLEAFKALTEKFRKMIDSGKLQVIVRHGRMIVKLPAGISVRVGKRGSLEGRKDRDRRRRRHLEAVSRSSIRGGGAHGQRSPWSLDVQEQPRALRRARGHRHRAARLRGDESGASSPRPATASTSLRATTPMRPGGKRIVESRSCSCRTSPSCRAPPGHGGRRRAESTRNRSRLR